MAPNSNGTGTSTQNALNYTVQTNYTLLGNPNMNQTISVFNFDMYSELAGDLDETPYLWGARALKDSLTYLNGYFRTAVITS